ncbi:MAG: EAL domain-containing protein, partial [Ruminiclostridium sp.]|nr:EAL domain-containing protein [Ruminiclostridium sp.]
MDWLWISSFDICSFVVLGFILISNIFRRMTKGTINRTFIVLINVSLLTCIFDIIGTYIDFLADQGLWLWQVIVHSLFLFFHNIIPPLFLLYIIALTDTFHIFGKHRTEFTFIVAPALSLIILMAVNSLNGFIFSVENGEYHRGPAFAILFLIGVVFGISSIIYMIVFRKLFTKTKFVALMSPYPLLFAAFILQYCIRSIRVDLFATTMGLLFVSAFIQRPEALIDFNTGIYKFNAFAMDMRRNFSNKKPVDLILINIANFLQIQDILSYDATNDMLRLVANRLKLIIKQSKTDAALYYLDKGRFSIIVNYLDHEKTEYTAETINAALKPKLPLNGMELNLISYICIAKCPEEISDFNTLIEFDKDLSSKFKFTGKVLHSGELLDKSRYNLMSEIDVIISDAVLNNKFEVFYQPIFNISRQKFLSAEALLRLYNEKYGFISPEIFIPVTEKTGSIYRVGLFVFEEVCKFI